MKKVFALVLTTVLLLSLTACGRRFPALTPGSDKPVSTKPARVSYDDSSLEGILDGIQASFDTVAASLESQWEMTEQTLGNSYESYCENKSALTAWYGVVSDETTALFAQADEWMAAYCKTIVDTLPQDDQDAWLDSLDRFREVVYEDCFDTLKDRVYDDLMDRVKDEYYDGVIKDGKDTVGYSEWVDTRSEAYSDWVDARSSFYSAWVDARSHVYSTCIDLKSAVWMGNFDIMAVLDSDKADSATAGTTQSTTEPTTEVTEPTAETTESTTEPATEAVSTGVTPEFKATMDAYEAFFDEYVDFMQKFASSENTLGMMTQYASMMARYAETMSALDEIDSDSLSEADALYYMEVTLRITKKLADIA